MARLRHPIVENTCYHVTSVTRGRNEVFGNAKNAGILVAALQHIRTQGKAYVLAYCVMPDHFHALIAPKEDTDISQIMQSIKGYVARRINAEVEMRGPIWQQGFFERAIRDESQLEAVVAYIHENPVKDGVVGVATDYAFSSAGHPELVDAEAYFRE